MSLRPSKSVPRRSVAASAHTFSLSGLPAARKRAGLLVSLLTLSLILSTTFINSTFAQKKKRRVSLGGRTAVVVDERLAVLRDAPGLSANLLQRLSRGRTVGVTGAETSRDGATFYRVVVTRRTGGWLQSDAVAVPALPGEDERLLRLIRASEDFDRLARARIFLDLFPRSALRSTVLMFYGDTAEEAAAKLSREAQKRLDESEMEAGGAPVASYFLNYAGLDRFNRAGVKFIFDGATKQFHYEGGSWREILRRYPRSAEAAVARRRLESLPAAAIR